jgi:Na+-driven multidrug efflux pump
MRVYKLCIPAILGKAIFLSQELMNLYFAGHLGDPTLVAGIGLGNMTINLFVISLLESFN